MGRFQYEHIAYQIVDEALHKKMNPVDLCDMIRAELAVSWEDYVPTGLRGTKTGTSVPAASDDPQNVVSKPEDIKKAVADSDEVLRQSRFR